MKDSNVRLIEEKAWDVQTFSSNRVGYGAGSVVLLATIFKAVTAST